MRVSPPILLFTCGVWRVACCSTPPRSCVFRGKYSPEREWCVFLSSTVLHAVFAARVELENTSPLRLNSNATNPVFRQHLLLLSCVSTSSRDKRILRCGAMSTTTMFLCVALQQNTCCLHRLNLSGGPLTSIVVVVSHYNNHNGPHVCNRSHLSLCS